jgi:thioredoxin-related protein
VKVHIKERKPVFERFNVHWTPTQLILDSDGVERHRIEGFLPVEDYLAQLNLGLGKLQFQKEDYARAEETLHAVTESFPKTGAGPEACYWEGVAAYKKSNDAKYLATAAKALKRRYPGSEWTRKATVWSH